MVSSELWSCFGLKSLMHFVNSAHTFECSIQSMWRLSSIPAPAACHGVYCAQWGLCPAAFFPFTEHSQVEAAAPRASRFQAGKIFCRAQGNRAERRDLRPSPKPTKVEGVFCSTPSCRCKVVKTKLEGCLLLSWRKEHRHSCDDVSAKSAPLSAT